MDEVAQCYFKDHPECNFVSIIEHGGWHLSYRRDGSIYGTANDRAVLKPGPRPDRLERIIRRDTQSDYWM